MARGVAAVIHQETDFIDNAFRIGPGDLRFGLFGEGYFLSFLLLDKRRCDFLDGFLAHTLTRSTGIGERLSAYVSAFRGFNCRSGFLLFGPEHQAIMPEKD